MGQAVQAAQCTCCSCHTHLILQVVVAVGGYGGRGNASQQSLPNRPPASTCEPGREGSSAHLVLETKTLADVAFVGLPNVGKSTLLSALTAARAKVGDAHNPLRDLVGLPYAAVLLLCCCLLVDGCNLFARPVCHCLPRDGRSGAGRGCLRINHICSTNAVGLLQLLPHCCLVICDF